MTANWLVLLGEQRMDDKPVHLIDRAMDLALWVAFLGLCMFFVWVVVDHWGG
jgi:hypothetical protein